MYTWNVCLLFIAEPGYYEDNKFGIRIENLVLVKKAPTKVYDSYNWIYNLLNLKTYMKLHIDWG